MFNFVFNRWISTFERVLCNVTKQCRINKNFVQKKHSQNCTEVNFYIVG